MSEGLAEAMVEAHGGEYPYPIYTEKLKPPRPFLVPSLDDEPVEILPSEKPNRKIRFEEEILVKEIPNRFEGEDCPEDDEEGSYEVEIVEEDDGDADFYLEIVDGEVFYVFETEDDISVESESDDETSYSESESEMGSGPVAPAQFVIPGAPNLDDSFGEPIPSSVAASTDGSDDFNASILSMGESMRSMGDSICFVDEDMDDMESGEESPALAHENISDNAPRNPIRCTSPWSEADEAPPSFEDSFQLSLEGDDPTSVAADMVKEDIVLLNMPGSPTKQTPAPIAAPQTPPQPSPAVVLPAAPQCPATSPGSVKSTKSTQSTRSAASARTTDSQVKSILKACPESPQKAPRPDSPRKKKKKGAPKTFTKTYVKAEQYEVDRVYGWEKPQWTDKKLKSTDHGEKLRKSGNLANPITFPKKSTWNDNPNGDEEPGPECEQVDMDELIRRLKGGDSAGPMNRRGQRKLKFSIHGTKIREGGDIVQPITKATVFRKRDDVNLVARPTLLRSTVGGEKVRTGGDIVQPITQATVRRKPDADVNHVANKNVLKNKVAPTRSKSYEWEKPEWTSNGLRSTKRGQLVKEGVDVAAPITHINKNSSDGNISANSDHVLEKERPFRRQVSDDLIEKKSYEWEKPTWAKGSGLRSTGLGEAIKSGEKLERPITFPVGNGSTENEEPTDQPAQEEDTERQSTGVTTTLSSDL